MFSILNEMKYKDMLTSLAVTVHMMIIIIRQMCRQDTKAVPTALTGALGSKNINYNSK